MKDLMSWVSDQMLGSARVGYGEVVYFMSSLAYGQAVDHG